MNKLIATLLIAATSWSATAAVHNMGTGGSKGQYFKMGNDIVEYCAPELTEDTIQVVEESGGSAANLQGLQTKQYSMGIVQLDDLMWNAKRAPSKVNDKVMPAIMALHTETVHVLVPKDFQPVGKDSGGWGKLTSFFSSDEPVTFDINLLKGQKVGAWGGSVVSASALSAFFDLKAQVTEIKPGEPVPFPIVRTAGYPDKVVQEYLASGKYVLIQLDYDVISNRASFYSKETVNYSVNGKMKAINTIGVRAYLVAKAFRKESRNQTARELATCITDSLADLADDPNTSPNWASVYEFNEQGQALPWQSFKLLEK